MKKIILDTDFGPDCDDCGALAVLHNLKSKGLCDILAVMHNTSDLYGAVSIKAANAWFGCPDIPIGQTERKDFFDSGDALLYTKPIADKYLSDNPMPEFDTPVRLYRKILSKNTDVSIVSIGFLTNIAELLNSEADDISPLSGIELVKNSVYKIFIMAGNFTGKEEHAEFNVRLDVGSALTVACKSPVKKVYLGWEVGEAVRCGHTLWSENPDYPVKIAYEKFGERYGLLGEDGTYDRQGWDPLTAYYAVTEDNSFMHESAECSVSFDSEGYTIVEDGETDTYLIADDVKKASAMLESLIKSL